MLDKIRLRPTEKEEWMLFDFQPFENHHSFDLTFQIRSHIPISVGLKLHEATWFDIRVQACSAQSQHRYFGRESFARRVNVELAISRENCSKTEFSCPVPADRCGFGGIGQVNEPSQWMNHKRVLHILHRSKWDNKLRKIPNKNYHFVHFVIHYTCKSLFSTSTMPIPRPHTASENVKIPRDTVTNP